MRENMLYGLSYDYAQNELGGIDLLLYKDPPLQNEDLARIPVNMLQSNDIPGLLPVYFEETDLRVNMRYDISGKRMLSQVVRAAPLSISGFYQMLLQIAEIVAESGNYMLSAEQYVLQEDFIFVGRDYEEIYLLYLPLANLRQNPSVQEGMRSLVSALLASLDNLGDRGIQQLLQYLQKANFSIAGLKNQILALIVELRGSDLSEHNHVSQNINGAGGEVGPPSSSLSWVWVFCAILLLGGSWIGYAAVPQEGELYIALGATVLAADGLYLARKLGKLPELSALSGKMASAYEQMTGAVKSNTDAAGGFSEIKTQPPEQSESVRQPAHTVLLSSSSALAKSFRLPHLEIERGQTIETVEMKNERFVIGRGPLAVDYAEHAPGVSRTHLEFIFGEDGCWARDLASLNGTHLNDERMASYKLYSLKDGDRIRILSSVFTFRWP